MQGYAGYIGYAAAAAAAAAALVAGAPQPHALLFEQAERTARRAGGVRSRVPRGAAGSEPWSAGRR
eukprot:scaffold67568_cov51-Phaeocystis_antarctica.AAC.1